MSCKHPEPLCIEEDSGLSCQKCGKLVIEVYVEFQCVVNPRSKKEIEAAKKRYLAMFDEALVNE